MCKLHAWLIKKAEELGATELRIEHGGRRGCAGRHRRHPFLVGIIDGKPFSCPLKSRPTDRSADYRWAYLRAIRARMPLPQRNDGPPSNPRNGARHHTDDPR